MLRYLLVVIIALHGLIHFMGFAKAFEYADLKQLTIPVSRTAGVLWLFAGLLFLTSAILLLLQKDSWLMLAIPVVILSQVVIILSWSDAKFGTIANVLILAAAILSWGSMILVNE